MCTYAGTYFKVYLRVHVVAEIYDARGSGIAGTHSKTDRPSSDLTLSHAPTDLLREAASAQLHTNIRLTLSKRPLVYGQPSILCATDTPKIKIAPP